MRRAIRQPRGCRRCEVAPAAILGALFSPPPCAPCRSCRPVRVRPPPSGTYGRRCSRRKRCSTPRCGPNWRTIPSWGKRELIRRYVRNALRRSRRVRKRGRAAARGLQDVSGVWRDVAMGLCRRMRRGRSRSECIANVPDCVRSPSRGSLIRQHRRASTMTDPWRRRSLGAASLFAGVRCCCDWETLGMEADCCGKNGRITRSNRCDGNQSGNSYEVDCATHVVGQGGEAELPADIAEPARQERALAHPLLDRTEGMLDRLPATIHHLGPGGETVRHALHR